MAWEVRRRFVNQRDEKLMDDLGTRINSERMRSRITVMRLASKANIAMSSVERAIIGYFTNSVTLLRIADAMDCDVVLVRRTKIKTIFEVDGAEEQLFKLKKERNDRQRKHQKGKISKREEYDRAQRERDFLDD
jgi:hypothetical protein